MLVFVILLSLVVFFFLLILFAFIIGKGFQQKFGKFDMPERDAKDFIQKLLPDISIPDYLFPILIVELKSLGFQHDITDEEVKDNLQKIIREENNPNDSVTNLKLFLGLNFGEDYKLIMYSNKKYHPDTPMNLSISLTESTFNRVVEHLALQNFEIKTTYSNDKKIQYSEKWNVNGDIYSKSYSASHFNRTDIDYTFFNVRLSVDIKTKIIRYSEFGS
jgi:hypothetical protein